MKTKLISIISIIIILIGLVPLPSKAVVPIDSAYIYANRKIGVKKLSRLNKINYL